MHIATNSAKRKITPGVGFVTVRVPSVEQHLPHTLTQLRTHARTHARHEHETKPKPISRAGSFASTIPLNLRFSKSVQSPKQKPSCI